MAWTLRSESKIEITHFRFLFPLRFDHVTTSSLVLDTEVWLQHFIGQYTTNSSLYHRAPWLKEYTNCANCDKGAWLN